jgi:uncharacterized protein (TIGR03067 family)
MGSTEKLHGVWQAISVTVSGVAIPESEVIAIRLTITGARFTTSRDAETLFDSTYSVDPEKSPREIQMIGVAGDFDGQAALGIYRFESEVLELCYTMPGFGRPTDFASGHGSGAFLIRLKRVQ